VALAFGYALAFDGLRAMGHCNVEVFPSKPFRAIPVLRYLIYTPTYHVIHHTEREANFCLFMPLFDLLGGTLDARSWEMQEQTSAGTDPTPRACVRVCYLALHNYISVFFLVRVV